MGRKVSDKYTVPLCRLHHRELHRRGNERAWWQKQGIEPLAVAAGLWKTMHERPTAGGAAAELTEASDTQLTSDGNPASPASLAGHCPVWDYPKGKYRAGGFHGVLNSADVAGTVQ